MSEDGECIRIQVHRVRTEVALHACSASGPSNGTLCTLQVSVKVPLPASG